MPNTYPENANEHDFFVCTRLYNHVTQQYEVMQGKTIFTFEQAINLAYHSTRGIKCAASSWVCNVLESEEKIYSPSDYPEFCTSLCDEEKLRDFGPESVCNTDIDPAIRTALQTIIDSGARKFKRRSKRQ